MCDLIHHTFTCGCQTDSIVPCRLGTYPKVRSTGQIKSQPPGKACSCTHVRTRGEYNSIYESKQDHCCFPAHCRQILLEAHDTAWRRFRELECTAKKDEEADEGAQMAGLISGDGERCWSLGVVLQRRGSMELLLCVTDYTCCESIGLVLKE